MSLETLDTIDWHALQGAYGPADKVPILLRKLATETDKARHNALRYDLVNVINHQTTIYEVTAPTVPFLVELLQDEAVPYRHEMLYMLGGFYSSYFESDQYKSQGNQDNIIESSWTRFQRESSIAVSSYLPLYLQLLNSLDAGIRLNDVHLLTYFRHYSVQILPQFLALLKTETESAIRVALVKGLWALTTPAQTYASLFESLFHDPNEAETVCWESACIITELSKITGQPLPDDIVELFVEAIRDLSTLDSDSKLGGEHKRFTASSSLYNFSAELADTTIINWLHLLAIAPDDIIPRLASSLIHIAFRDISTRRQASYTSMPTTNLTDAQRTILTALCDDETVWNTIPVDVGILWRPHPTPMPILSNVLNSVGLPKTRETLCAFLNTL